MPPQENSGAAQRDKGTITVSDDDIVQEVAGIEAQKMVAPAAPSPTWWDRVNKGLISPDRFLSWATGGHMKSVAELEKERDKGPDLKETPSQAFSRTFHSGATADLAKTASTLTSPVALSTAAVSQGAKIPGVLGQVSRGLLTGTGLAYGAAGAGDVISGVGKGVKTPQGAQQALAGGSQVAAAAPAVANASRLGRGIVEKVAPQLFARGEGAFVAALAPPSKRVSKLRDAYRQVEPELKASNVRDLPELLERSSMKRVEAAQELNQELARINPQATQINHYAAADAIRNRVNWSISTSSPKEAKVIIDYAQRVQDELFQNPIDLGKAEAIVQQLNEKSVKFDNLPERDQRYRLANGDPILGEKALKIALQQQIEAKLAGYKDLKRRYGAWKEIQDQTQTRIDDIERKGANLSFWKRRSLQDLFAGLGTGAAGMAIHGGAEGFAGGAAAYLFSKFAAEMMVERLANPESALQRGLQPPKAAPRPLPFAGQIAQPVASRQASDADTDTILNQMFGAPRQ